MNKQRGAVLVIALIFLLLITAIAASLMSSGSFQTVMVANKQKRDDYFHRAEASTEIIYKNQAIYNTVDRVAVGTAVSANALLARLPVDATKVDNAVVEKLTIPGDRQPVAHGQSFSSDSPLSAGRDFYEIRAEATASDNSMGTELVLGVSRPNMNPN